MSAPRVWFEFFPPKPPEAEASLWKTVNRLKPLCPEFVSATDISLTDSLAMWPTSSVSGLYFAHPDARYFTLGQIGKDQLQTYSDLRNEPIDEGARWLAPVLG